MIIHFRKSLRVKATIQSYEGLDPHPLETQLLIKIKKANQETILSHTLD